MPLFKTSRAQARRNKILNSVKLPDTGSLLDLSCGDGSLLGEIKVRHPRLDLHGTDISSETIAQAKSKHHRISFNIADSTAMPYPEHTFDIVVCSLALHHYQSPEKSLTEMSRVLKPSGKLYIIDVAPANKILQKIANFIGCREPYHFEKYYTDREVVELAQFAGLYLTNKTKLTAISRLMAFELQKPKI